jgi:hypothetical protein
MYVLAFDRDWTVDVNPHPHRDAVPLEWVRYWAHEAEHEVWAIGNQDLVEEADIPGTVESVRRRDGHIEVLGEQDEPGTTSGGRNASSACRFSRSCSLTLMGTSSSMISI